MARSKSGSADEPAEVDVQEAEVDEVGDLVDEAVDPTAVDQHDVEVHAYSSSSVPTDTPVEASETPSPSEQSESLTDERLLNQKKTKEPPEGAFQRFLYEISFHLIDIGDSRAARERKALDRRIAQPFDQGARYVPVLTRKGGVGKTTVTTLLGMALAEVRDDRVIAIDANPDRGTLAERVPKSTAATVRDVVKLVAGIKGSPTR
jgi:ATPases involved in chromosome partitioning